MLQIAVINESAAISDVPVQEMIPAFSTQWNTDLNAAWGVGRLIGGVPSCRVLCVYLRGARQEGFGSAPPRGEHFHVRLAVLRPRSELTGMRRARDLSQQVVRTLVQLEEQHDRQ